MAVNRYIIPLTLFMTCIILLSSPTKICAQQNKNVTRLLLDFSNTLDELKSGLLKDRPQGIALQQQINILSNHLFNLNEAPDSLYMSILREEQKLLDSVAKIPSIDSSSGALINEIIEDLAIKNNSMASGQLAGESKFLMNVEVQTRELVNGNFAPVNGYKIFANPWLIRNKKPAKIVFTNSTNPGTVMKIPPGKYYIWAASPTIPTKTFPLTIDFSKVIYRQDNLTQIIYIDIIK